MCIIEEHGIKPTVVDYLNIPPTEKEIIALLKKLKMKAVDIVRKSEPIYKAKFSKKEYSEAQWIKILSKNPILIERPIVVKGAKAIIARPAEKVLDLL